MTMTMKHLSSSANDLLHISAQILNTSVEKLVEDFLTEWKPELGDYSRKLVEFCSTRALAVMCKDLNSMIADGSFSRSTFDMMLAWEKTSSTDEESHTGLQESVAKEKEDMRKPVKVSDEQDGIPLFYSDLMPLLVDNEPDIGEDGFVSFASIFPLVADIVNGRFSFETLTAPTGHRLHFPAYDKFLKEIDKCIKHLQKQAVPNGMELADDEFILHVEGTASTQRVVRHIGGTSWPGRLTLTNYALYFEASGVITYENALKIDLSKDVEHSVKAAATGPFGAPLYDKAIVYESPELSEGILLEFPELTSSTRRDHWLALMKEVMLMHQFLSKYKVDNPTQVWEMHARTILGIVRLHAAREMLRISPPVPTKFLIFSLFDELPKGDYVLEELAERLKKDNGGHLISASTILRSLNMPVLINLSKELQEVAEGEIGILSARDDNLSSLENTINQVREEAKEIDIAKATTEGLKEEGISDSVVVLMELVSPLKSLLPWFQEVLRWERPATTLTLISMTLLIVYKEWVHQAVAALLFWGIAKMLRVRQERIKDKFNEIVVYTGSDKTTMENIVSAQQGLRTAHEMVQMANIAILKIWSILVSKAQKQAEMVMMALSGLAILLAVIPLKVIIMFGILYYFTMTSKIGKYIQNDNGEKRLKEWWDSIPIIPVRVIDKVPDSPTVRGIDKVMDNPI